MLKLNRLLYTTTADVFHDAITPSSKQRALLEDAKNIIRDYLRVEITKVTISVLGLDKAVTPRFRTQGSWSYGTCVQPAWPERQQIDWDFGIYLPVTVWESNGPPHAMAKLYFDLVEKLLGKLCEKHGWRLVSGKDTCIRVEVSSTAHIDLPLYAAPEAEFTLIRERLIKAARARGYADSALTMDSAELPEQEWEDLDRIVLATRSGEWKASDPEQISKWFRDRIEEHGPSEQLRRVCMYLKAWRDFHWRNGDGPTSVCIMVAVVDQFRRCDGRDDLALEASAVHLSKALLGEVRCDGVDQSAEDFNRRLTDEQKRFASEKATTLARELKRARERAVGSANAQQAIDILIVQLGVRIPALAHLVDGDGSEEIRATAARKVPPPVVRSTQAG
jgi:hypothetical protein